METKILNPGKSIYRYLICEARCKQMQKHRVHFKHPFFDGKETKVMFAKICENCATVFHREVIKVYRAVTIEEWNNLVERGTP